jgi:hypothetical protein
VLSQPRVIVASIVAILSVGQAGPGLAAPSPGPHGTRRVHTFPHSCWRGGALPGVGQAGSDAQVALANAESVARNASIELSGRSTARGRSGPSEKVGPDEGLGGFAIGDRDPTPPPSVGSVVPGSQQSRHLKT